MILFLVPPAAILSAKFISNLFYSSWSRTNHSPLEGESERQGQRPQPSRWGVRWSARALSIPLLLSLAHPHTWQLPSALGRDLPGEETNRRLAMLHLRANDNALLVVSAERSWEGFKLYTGFDAALYSRIRQCDIKAIASGERDIIIYINKPLSTWVHRTYGDPHCNPELRQLAEARGFTILRDHSTYLALSPQQRAPTQ